MEQHKDRKTLKGYFKKGSIPTEEQFASLIDSVPNIAEDGQAVRTSDGWSFYPEAGKPLQICLHEEEGKPAATVKAFITSTAICVLLPAIIHLVFVGNAYFAYRTIFPDARGYIGGEQVMGIVVGTIIINTVGFFMNKKTNSIWPTLFATLPLVAWFQVTASGMTF